MKNYFLIITLLFNSLILFSQEISIKIVEIKSLDTNTITNSSFSLKKINAKGLTNKKKNNYFNYNLDFDILSNENIIDITKSTELVTPTWIIKQKFKEGSQNKSIKADYYLGNLETQSKYIIIKYRDHEYVDGDRIRLMLNNSIIHPNISLSSVFYVIDIDLDEGYNNIDFIALNEGDSSPNTAQLLVLDENGVVLSNKKWLLYTGYKAQLVVYKK
ncbi:MAG: hypothetical protein CMC34_00305 [Flavobacteriaceae bacterium]|nr:hypothetical protein [Flavobacteriaceae bacterium]